MAIEGHISVTDMARTFGVSRQAVQKMLKGEDSLEVKKVGAGYLYKIDSLPKDMQDRLKSSQKEAAENVISKSEKKNKGVHFKKELWQAADKLRGNIDASDYKHIVLGMLFLKYVSDAFYIRRDELDKKLSDPEDKKFYMPEEKAREVVLNDKDQYRGANGFYIPEKARWDYLRAKSSQPGLDKVLDEAMFAIEEENVKQLKGVLPKHYVRIPIENSVLGELINIFSRIEFDHDLDHEKDMLGEVYEYFLGQFASSEGKRGGEFYTPRSLVRLIVEILEPYENARVFDPACGSGGMFVQVGSYLRERKKDPSRIAISGQESNLTTWRLCKMNLAIKGLNGDVEVGDSYHDDKFPDLRAEFVIANPPFNADWEPKQLSDNDPRIKFGVPPSGNANFMWIQHFIHHLAPNGMAGFVMANGALAAGGKEGKIREKIIEADVVDVIVACPPKLFHNVSLPVSLWFISKDKKKDRFRNRSGETLFIDAREDFEQVSRKQVIFNDENIKRVTDAVRAWRGEEGAPEYKDVPGFCKSVKLEDIKKAGYVLTPGRYVGLPEEEDDGVPFAEKMQKLSAELREAFERGDDLEAQIISNLKKLGV